MSSNSRYKSKNDADEAVSVVSLTSSSGGYINGRNSANLELLIDKTSSINAIMQRSFQVVIRQKFVFCPLKIEAQLPTKVRLIWLSSFREEDC